MARDTSKLVTIPGELHSAATGNIVAAAEEVFDYTTNRYQKDINQEVAYIKEDSSVDPIPSFNPQSQTVHLDEQVLSNAQKKQVRKNIGLGNGDIDSTPTSGSDNVVRSGGVYSSMQELRSTVNPQVGYYTCSTAGNTAAKVIDASGYTLLKGGGLRVNFTEKNTAANATLNIEQTGAKPLYYNGVRVSTNNSWYAGEVMTLFYDGAAFQLNSLPDLDEYDVSARNGGQAFTFAEAVALVPEAYKHGGLKLRFISNSESGQSSDNKYVQYRYTSDSIDNFVNIRNWVTTEGEIDALQTVVTALDGRVTALEQGGSDVFQSIDTTVTPQFVQMWIDAATNTIRTGNYDFICVPVVANKKYRVKCKAKKQSNSHPSMYFMPNLSEGTEGVVIQEFSTTLTEYNFEYKPNSNGYICARYGSGEWFLGGVYDAEVITTTDKIEEFDELFYTEAALGYHQGYIVPSTGLAGGENTSVVPTSGWGVTDYIEVNDGDKVYYDVSSKDVPLIACYNPSKTYLQSSSLFPVNASTYYQNTGIFTVPAGVGYIRCTMYIGSSFADICSNVFSLSKSKSEQQTYTWSIGESNTNTCIGSYNTVIRAFRAIKPKLHIMICDEVIGSCSQASSGPKQEGFNKIHTMLKALANYWRVPFLSYSQMSGVFSHNNGAEENAAVWMTDGIHISSPTTTGDYELTERAARFLAKQMEPFFADWRSKKVLWIGTSEGAGYNNGAANSYPNKIATQLGFDIENKCVPGSVIRATKCNGTTVQNSLLSSSLYQRFLDPSDDLYVGNFDLVIINHGINDYSQDSTDFDIAKWDLAV